MKFFIEKFSGNIRNLYGWLINMHGMSFRNSSIGECPESRLDSALGQNRNDWPGGKGFENERITYKNLFWQNGYPVSLILICFILLMLSGVSGQSLRSIQATAGYNAGAALPGGQKLNSVKGFGSQAIIQFDISEHFKIALNGGYSDSKIEQNDAVEQWNWPFWQRFYRNYTNSLVSLDSNYSVIMTPKQNLYLIPVSLSLEFYYPQSQHFLPFISLGGGIVFYERNLRLNERWTKYFPEIDHYFSYEYDNHAHVKKGEVYQLSLTLGSEYKFSKHFALIATADYTHYLIPGHDKDFPLKNAVNGSLGLVFYY